jgi:hypothetical protein
LTSIHFATRTLDFMGSRVANKVKILTGNSVTFDFSPWKDSIDIVFIDGGHDLATVGRQPFKVGRQFGIVIVVVVMPQNAGEPILGDNVHCVFSIRSAFGSTIQVMRSGPA